MSISITFHGAARMVTGSKHLLQVNDHRVLLDCGMFQGEGEESDRKNRHFGFAPHAIDAVVLSHAHIDHSGLLPRLVAEGFEGIILCTPATRDLCAVMLADSARIQESDHERDVRHADKGEKVPPPLYTEADVAPMMKRFVDIPYGTPYEVVPGVTVTFTDAGHILGSAVVNIVADDGERSRRILFSGDVGRYADRILPFPAVPPQADVVICESTYGDREHAAMQDAEEALWYQVHHTCVEKKGKLIIPAFSVGKTQEVLYTLNELSNAGRLPRIPVYVDSPLGIEATKVVKAHSDLFSEKVRAELANDPDLFSFLGVEYVKNSERSKQLNDTQEPCIVISASGMMEAGRIRHHLRHSLDNPRNTILAVGFCAPGTLGDRILRGDERVFIFGQPVEVKAEVVKIGFYSAHADRKELVRFLKSQDPAKVEHLFLVHGVEQVQERLREKLLAEGFRNVAIPAQGTRVEL